MFSDASEEGLGDRALIIRLTVNRLEDIMKDDIARAALLSNTAYQQSALEEAGKRLSSTNARSSFGNSSSFTSPIHVQLGSSVSTAAPVIPFGTSLHLRPEPPNPLSFGKVSRVGSLEKEPPQPSNTTIFGSVSPFNFPDAI